MPHGPSGPGKERIMKKYAAICMSAALLLCAACGNQAIPAASAQPAESFGVVVPASPIPESVEVSTDSTSESIGADSTAPETVTAEEPETEVSASDIDSVGDPATAETAPEAPVFVWRQDTPENQNIDPAALAQAHETYDTFPLLSAVIVRNGYVVDAYFKDGYDADTSFILNSASKSITSALVGIAIEQGYIESVDVPIAEYFPQLMERENPEWQRITLRHLLTHTSGIATTDEARWDAWRSSENWVDYILALPLVSTPGETFSYSTGNTHLVSAILEQATGIALYDFGKEVLFDRVGMESVSIDSDPQGVADGGNNIWMNVYDMARFGLLYLQGGAWAGEQIVPADWVAQSTSTQFVPGGGRADYGYQWWVRTFGDAAYGAYFAQGHAGQYIIVVPELQLVIAFTSDYEGSSSIYWQLVNTIVNGCG